MEGGAAEFYHFGLAVPHVPHGRAAGGFLPFTPAVSQLFDKQNVSQAGHCAHRLSAKITIAAAKLG